MARYKIDENQILNWYENKWSTSPKEKVFFPYTDVGVALHASILYSVDHYDVLLRTTVTSRKALNLTVVVLDTTKEIGFDKIIIAEEIRINKGFGGASDTSSLPRADDLKLLENIKIHKNDISAIKELCKNFLEEELAIAKNGTENYMSCIQRYNRDMSSLGLMTVSGGLPSLGKHHRH